MAGSINVGTVTAYARLDTSKMVSGTATAKSSLKDYANTAEREAKRAGVAVEREAKRAAMAASKAYKDLAQSLSRSMMLAGTAVAAGLGMAIKKAADFDQAMRNVNSIAHETEAQFQKTSKSVLELTDNPSIRQGPADLAKGMYDVVSSGFQGAKALEILEVSALGASAGMTDTATSSRVLMAVLNSGIKGVSSVSQAMDVLFQEVNLGVNSFEGLAGALGDVLPTAKVAGVSIQEINAALAVMTRRGINVNESVTALNQLLNHIIKPGKESAKVMEALGIQHGALTLQTKGLTGVLEQMGKKTHGNVDALVHLMPEIRAMKGLLTLTDEGGKQYTEMLKGMTDATQVQNATQRAANEQMKGSAAQYEKAKQQAERLGVEIGSKLLPVVNRFLGWIKETATAFAALTPEMQSSIAMFAAIGAGALLAGGAVVKLTLGVIELGTQLKTLGVISAAGAFLTNPWVLGTAAVVGLGVALYNTTKETEKSTKEMVADAQAVANSAEAASTHAKEIKNLAEQYRQLSTKTKPTAEDHAKLKDLMNQIGTMMPELVKAWDKQGNALGFVDGWAKKLAAHMADVAVQSQRAAEALKLAQAQDVNMKRGKLLEERSSLQDLLRTGSALRKNAPRIAYGPGGGAIATNAMGDSYSRQPGATPSELAVTAKQLRAIDAEVARLSHESKQILGIGPAAKTTKGAGSKTQPGSGGGGGIDIDKILGCPKYRTAATTPYG